LTFDFELNISEMNEFDLIDEEKIDHDLISCFCNEIIKINITFDNCGICSIRFDFEVKKDITTNNLIELFDKSLFLTDKYLLNKIKDDLDKTDIKFFNDKNDLKIKDIKSDLLKDPMWYTVISSINKEPVSYPKEEIFGVSWNYEDYNKANCKIINEITSNDISLQEDDTLIVTKQSTLMIFVEVNENYIEDRIIAIEMFWRQKLLLKKLDYKIIKLFKCINDKKTKDNLELLIKKIKKSQISVHSDLEAYRNSILSVTDSFSMLFKTLNKVFELDTHFNFVQSKLDACDNIYEGLHDEKRNKLMERIQWIIIGLGIANIAVLVIFEFM